MVDIGALFRGFGMIFELQLIIFMFAGVLFGLILGSLPGLTGSMGIALMLPFTYTLDPLASLVFLLSIYSGGLFGGAITSVLLNTPGSSANMATIMDGYPMTLNGEGDKALGLALYSSVLGGIVGALFLFLVMEPLANLALSFGPPEMFMVAIFGLTVVGSLSTNILKSLYAGLFGILLGTVGMTPIGSIRGTFGSMYLVEGIPLIPALIGFLAVPELFNLISRKYISDDGSSEMNHKKMLYAVKELIKKPFLALRSSVLGVIVGVMPAAGATVASLLSYNQAKQWSENSDQFGKGHPEGVIASEAANNSSQGGALATMLVLGIPGSASTAMLLGALMLQGWVPGPRLFIENREIIYASISSLFVQQFVMLIVAFLFCMVASKIVTVPTKYLVPCIMLFTILGSFSGRNALFDSMLMFIFGVIGWFMKRNNFPVMPIVLGIILGPIADRELLRMVQANVALGDVLLRPIVLVLLVLSIASIVVPPILQKRKESASVGS